MALLFARFAQTLSDCLIDVMGALAVDLQKHRGPRLATNQRRQALGAGRDQYRIALEVAHSKPRLDDFLRMRNPTGFREYWVYSTPIPLLPRLHLHRRRVLTELVVVNSRGAYLRPNIATGTLPANLPGGLFRRHFLTKSHVHSFVNIGIVTLPCETNGTPPARANMSHRRTILLAARPVPCQNAPRRRPAAPAIPLGPTPSCRRAFPRETYKMPASST